VGEGALSTGPFDFGAYDVTHRNTFANQARYEASYPQELTSVCPYALYDDETRDHFLALLASPGATPSQSADCGSASTDVPGTVAGSWFDPATLEGVMAVAQTSSGQIRVVGDGWSTWVDLGAPTNIAPDTVVGVHCYTGRGSWTFLSLQDDGSLRVAHGSGGCPASLPIGAQTLIR
jgi:hypothetical protein